ncbi:MAG: transketolase C-terminal domain-containing protein [bacterium]|nr:transketolase family protein [bacterium]MBU1917441.1 transketolase family protein [bacterium]
MSLDIATREAYGKKLAALGETHPEIVVMDADLSGSTKTNIFKKQFPERFFNVGVAEQNLMGTAAGIALSGHTVFVSTFAIFATGRAWEPVRQSIAYPKANVKICATHAGITVGEDGASHQSVEDIALMSAIPGMKVMVPADAHQTMSMMDYLVKTPGPAYLRLGRATTQQVFDADYVYEEGKGAVLRDGTDVCLFTTGFVTKATLDAATRLEEKGVSASVVCMGSIKPIDADLIVAMASKHKVLFSVEEHSVVGGLGAAISEVLTSQKPARLFRLGIQDAFGQSAPYQELIKHYELDEEGIARQVLGKLAAL